MKKIIKNIILVLIFTLAIFSFASCDFDDEVKYELTDEGAVIVGYGLYFDTPEAGYTIPSEIDGNKIIGIADDAFYDVTQMGNVTISEGIRYIGDRAFAEAFYLKSVYIPASVTQIGENAFGFCRELTSISVSPDNPSYTSIDGNLYTKDGKTLLQYCAGKEERDVVLESSVTSVAPYAFSGAYRIISFDSGSGVESIGGFAFEKCSNLESVTFGASVFSVGEAVFRECFELSALNLAEGNESLLLSDNVLYTADMSELVLYAPFKTALEYEVPNSVRKICGFAFYNSNVRELALPCSVETIGVRAFDLCSNLKLITVPEENEAYKTVDGVLYTKDGSILIEYPQSAINEEFYIPDGVTTVAARAFSGCRVLARVSMSSDVLVIENEAFYECEKLTEVTLSENLTAIGDGAFYNTEIKDIKFPPSLVTIGNEAFASCPLDRVILGKGVKRVGDRAFAYNFLDELDLGNVEYIGDEAFSGFYYSMKEVVIPESVTHLGEDAIDADYIRRVKFEDSSGWVGSNGEDDLEKCFSRPWFAKMYLKYNFDVSFDKKQ